MMEQQRIYITDITINIQTDELEPNYVFLDWHEQFRIPCLTELKRVTMQGVTKMIHLMGLAVCSPSINYLHCHKVDPDCFFFTEFSTDFKDLTSLRISGAASTRYDYALPSDFLKKLKGLTCLDIGGCPLVNLDGISALKDTLESLSVNDCCLTSLSEELADMGCLKTLEIWSNPLHSETQLNSITNIKNLEKLHAFDCKVQSIPQYTEWYATILSLDLSMNSLLRDASPLVMCKKAREIRVSFTQISDITWAEGLEALRYLEVEETFVTLLDISRFDRNIRSRPNPRYVIDPTTEIISIELL